jgi:hypothetical protein
VAELPGTVEWGALLPERVPVSVDDLPWEEFVDGDGNRLGVMLKWVVDPSRGRNCMLLRLPPNHRSKPHWHTSDTLYLVTQGEFVVEGEPSYFPGQVRWVRGGFAYGSEGAGPDGCEFYFFSLGPYGQHDPEIEPPPLGRWDDGPATPTP